MNLQSAYLRASVETIKQLEACLDFASSHKTDPEGYPLGLVYLDAAFFDAEKLSALVEKVHAADILCGLRLPYIWRKQAEQYFTKNLDAVRTAGFDVFLFRNLESLLFFHDGGLLTKTSYVTDHSMYTFNPDAEKMLMEMLPDAAFSTLPDRMTFPLELNEKELRKLSGKSICSRELVVYGRAPMMVSAQCPNKTVNGCDHREKVLSLRDRTGAKMPVKNCCRFCQNQIYNAVPTVLYDQKKALEQIKTDSIRFEFTVESGSETAGILGGELPKEGSFTRGHFKRGV